MISPSDNIHARHKHILLIEEDAQDYLAIRQFLEQSNNKYTIDWAPNYENAYNLVKQNCHDIYLVGYQEGRSKQVQQQQFLSWLYAYTTVPTILLTRNELASENLFFDKYKADYLCKSQLTSETLERAVRYVSGLIELQQTEKRFQLVFNNVAEIILLLHPNGTILEANQATLDLMDLRRLDVIGIPMWEIPWMSLSTHLQERLKTAVVAVARGESIRFEMDVQNKQGQIISISLTTKPIFNAQGKVIWSLIEGYDITKHKRTERRLMHATLHDPLTGLPNRQLFMEYLERAMARAKYRKSYRVAVLFIDLDRFKVINDSLGHDMGDWLLMEIARRLIDCVPRKNFLARSSGDEFMILLDDIQDFKEATHLASVINEELAKPFSLDGYEIVTSASIGIAYSNEGEDGADLLRDADVAMYRAKALGKSCYAVFSSHMHAEALSRLQIETDLYRALEQQSFVLFYQPQTDLATDQLTGAEALVRFCHPQNGIVMPLNFMSILEDTGIIITLGEWILQKACSQLKDWINAGLNVNHIAVNLSAHQFRSKRLIDIVSQSLETSNLDPTYLELELTESLLLEDMHSAVKTLTRFKEMGIRVTIDDFGTGYSSLSYLKRLPADSLKIDKSFIRGITNTPEDATITVATIDMAHALGLRVIAEGVETVEQRDFLRDHGCDFAQGYLYARPMEDVIFFNWAMQYNKMVNLKALNR